MTSHAAPGARARALRIQARALPEDRYSILGAEVSLRTDSREVRTFFSHAYRWFPSSSALVDIELVALFARTGESGPSASAGSSWIDLSRSASPQNRAFLFLLEAIMDAVEASVVVHGAAVSLGKTGVILAGPAMAGKSTLALELLRLGYTFLSDDAAPLERRSGLLVPFPRAVGVRKTGLAQALPPEGVLELPHKWLVDPEGFGASLPAAACSPEYLFYLDADPAPRPGAREFEVAFAEPVPEVVREIGLLPGCSARSVEGRPFPVIAARFAEGERAFVALADLWSRRRDAILFIDEVRPAAPRRAAQPSIRRVEATGLLLPIARDVLNRGEGGALMSSHAGRLTSLVVELARLLGSVRCFAVASGSPGDTALAIDRIVREGKDG
ncbi:MAG: hypothetical protein HY049_06395 [Acidobacteria bacterium]|nr:hypothetical protein [Acidobacteriota bacterium]